MLSDSYLRKSTADAGKSVSRQERDWRADCEANGFTIGRAFVDPDLSASRYARKERPDYGALVDHIGTGQCQMLSLWESSRGSREMGEWVSLLDLCRQQGVLIRIFGGSAETFDPRKPRDREALLHDGIAAERESETIAGRARDGARDLAYSGKPPGPLLFGYTRRYDERGKLVAQEIHPERAAIIRRCAEETLRGISLNSQANRLNDAGIPSPKGGTWTGHGIARMLCNPGYISQRVHVGEVIAEAIWEPILDRDQHEALNALLHTPGRRNHTDSTLAHELSGAAVCSECGLTLRTQGRTRYVCRLRGCGKVTASIALMDAAVGRIICARLARPDAASVFMPASDSREIEAARRELRGLKDHLAGFVEQAKARKLTAESLAAVEAGIVPEIRAAERKIRSLSMPSALAAYVDVDIPGEWERFEPAVRREFILATAQVVLSPCGKGGRWTLGRLAKSRWIGDTRTWGEIWQEDQRAG